MPAPTYQDFDDRFIGLDASAHQSWVTDRLAEEWQRRSGWRDRAEACLLAVAHRYVLETDDAAAAGRLVKSVRTGDLSISYGDASSGDALEMTSYGKQLQALRKQQPGRLPKAAGR